MPSANNVRTFKFGDAEANAVKNAVAKKSNIITTDLDAHFREAKAKTLNPSSYVSGLNPSSTQGIRKIGGGRTVQAFSVDRVFDVPHNPFRNRMAVETPQNLVELYQRYRYYYAREPLVRTSLELHSEFPLSTFELNHEDAGLRDEFNDIAENLNLFDFMLDMVLEYFVIGECFPFGIFDDPKDPSVWKSFVLLNPLNIEISHVPITDGRPDCTFRLKIDDSIKAVVNNGARDPITGELYKRIPSDVIRAVRSGGYMDLNPLQISHFKRKGNYFKVRGESMLLSILHLLAYRDKIRDSTYATVDRQATPRELWKVGETNNPATEDELATVASMVANSFYDPLQSIVYHHAVSVEQIGAADNKILPLRQELDKVEEEMLIGLMMNKGFLDTSYGAYANMSVALDILIARYITLRQRVERWMKDSVWGPICRIHNIYKPTQAELAHRIRVKNKEQRPWVPDVLWSKHELKDPSQKVQLMMTLRDKLGISGQRPGFPSELIYQAVNQNPKTIKRMINKEVREAELLVGLPAAPKAGPGGGLPGGIPGGGEGGGMDLGTDLDSLQAPIGEIPGGALEGGGGEIPGGGAGGNLGDLGAGVTIQPPGNIENQNSSTGGSGGLA